MPDVEKDAPYFCGLHDAGVLGVRCDCPPEDWCDHHPEWTDDHNVCHHPLCVLPPEAGKP